MNMGTKELVKVACVAILFTTTKVEPASPGPETFEASRITAQLKFLASDSLQGRRAGSRGGRVAADYIRNQFEALELMPAGDEGSFYQEFTFISDAVVGSSNFLKVICKDEIIEVTSGEKFAPLSSSANATVQGEVVFAGYGLRNEERGYDDFGQIELGGRIAMVLDDVPPHLEGAEAASGKFLLRKKAMLARESGAEGLLLVRGKDKEATLGRMKYDQIPGDVGIAYAEVTWDLAEQLLDCSGISLDSIAEHMERSQMPSSFILRDVTAELRTEVIKKRAVGRNVVAILRGSDPILKDQHIVIGAHYDHIGMESMEDGSRIIYNGADDNASGVVGLLELAAALSGTRPERSIVFAAFDAEELGALGSMHFTKNPPVPHEQLVAMVNMDMIGRMQDNTLIVSGYDTSPLWEGLLDEANEGIGLNLKKSAGGFGGSDHTSFYKDGIPVLFFFTGAHDDYNTPRDDWERINTDGEAVILAYIERVVEGIAHAGEPPPFKKSEVKTSGRERSGLSVYMGTVPDFAYEGEGFAIIGTKEGSPAERAGLRKGDIIVLMDGKAVRNIYDFMGVLSEHRPGDTISVTVTRGKRKASMEVTLESKK